MVLHLSEAASVYLYEAELGVQAAAVTAPGILLHFFPTSAKNMNYLFSLNLVIICPDLIFHIVIHIRLESGTDVFYFIF